MRILVILLAAVLSGVAHADYLVKGVRMWPSPDNTRLVFDVNGPVEHSLFTLSDPERIVIDIKGSHLAKPLQGLDYSKGVISNIRTAVQANGDLRVVLDLKKRVLPKSFSLQPNAEYGNRLVVDLADPSSPPEVEVSTPVPTPVPAAPARNLSDAVESGRDIVVAIDAGHGGEDPGASGPKGTHEKDVVLAIALKLNELIKHEKGMRPVLTRNGDYFIPLGRRVEIAREHKADLFVSIHADAFKNRSARGSSVFTLSQRGASSAYARMLAQRENDSDLIGGVSLDDKDQVLASVLLDLSQTATMEASSDVAGQVLSQLRSVNPLHASHVEQAGFRVLKAPDLPSILVETAFISNPSEERKLRDNAHQLRVATALMQGIRSYFRKNPPPGTWLAQEDKRRHVIAQGDTLSAIAKQYQVSLDSIRSYNHLNSDSVQVGQVLQIPAGSDS